LAPFVEDYRRELRERGYTERSAVGELRQVARFSCWLQAGRLSVSELAAGRVEEFLGWQRAVGRHRSQWSRPGLVCLLDVLRGLGVLAAGEPAQVGSPAEVLLAGFGRYLAAERGLASGTVGGYVSHARRFLDGLPAGTGLAGVRARDVTEAVLRESAAVSVSATQFFVAGLRSFLRFCFIERRMPVDLSQAALPVTGRRRSLLPRGITKAEARALLGGCDRRSALGRRDYAMLVTLLRLGLRASEVARLRLDDIDWRAGELVVRLGTLARVVSSFGVRWPRVAGPDWGRGQGVVVFVPACPGQVNARRSWAQGAGARGSGWAAEVVWSGVRTRPGRGRRG
jgi:integrase/recombinase XerD